MAAFFGFFSVASSAALSTASVPASFAFSSTCSVAALTALSLLPPQPLPAGLTTSSAGFTTCSAPPALFFSPLQPLPAACAPGKAMPPAVIRPATPRPAKSFLRSLFAIETSSEEEMEERTHRKRLYQYILS